MLAFNVWSHEYLDPPSAGAGWWLELETKVIRRFAKVSIVSYSRPSLMIIASASQFHVYLLWVNVHSA